MAADNSSHGLSYPSSFLQSLPILPEVKDCTSNANPIRLIKPDVLSSLHISHTLSHPPDHVLFPFLHGVEPPAKGPRNSALEGFFLGVDSTSGGGELASSAVAGVAVPRFRGLICVVAEQDLDEVFPSSFHTDFSSEGEEEEEDFTDSEDDGDLGEEGSHVQSMEVDTGSELSSPQIPQTPTTPFTGSYPYQTIHIEDGISSPMLPTLIDESKEKTSANDESHMHPLHDRRGSSASQVSSTSTFSDATTAYSDSTNLGSSLGDLAYGEAATPAPAASVTQPLSAPSRKSSNKSLKQNRSPSQLLTCTFRPGDIIQSADADADTADPQHTEYEFTPPNVPDGISLRNFGIQVPIYATISDIVVYSPKGLTPHTRLLAERLQTAVRRKYEERKARSPPVNHSQTGDFEMEMDMELETPPSSDPVEPLPRSPSASSLDVAVQLDDADTGLLRYNVFVLDSTVEEMRQAIPHLMVRYPDEQGHATPEEHDSGSHTDGTDGHAMDEEVGGSDTKLRSQYTTIDFAQREREEMRDLTRASEIMSVFPPSYAGPDVFPSDDLRTTRSHWDPNVGQIFLGNATDVPLQGANPPYPSNGTGMPILDAHDPESPFNSTSNSPDSGFGYDICVECHDLAPLPTVSHMRNAEEHLTWLDSLWAERCRETHPDDSELPPRPPPNANAVIHLPLPSSPQSNPTTVSALISVIRFLEKWIRAPNAPAPTNAVTSSSSARRWSSVSAFLPFGSAQQSGATTPTQTRTRSFTSPHSVASPPLRSRPLKVLMYSTDGYTESSVPALCLLMALRNITLPEAYLTLQVEKRRSFFVYEADLAVLRRVEARVKEGSSRVVGANRPGGPIRNGTALGMPSSNVAIGRPSAKSISFAQPPMPGSLPTSAAPTPPPVVARPEGRTRPRANTSPWLPSIFGDHQSWFNDPRFDGSFPSRVLPFLYLGNLNHASNVYMLHALGITHVVSVGECALVPPPSAPGTSGVSTSFGASISPGTGHHYVPGKTGHGSLWIEEREGRIKVLDIQGVCDDGIDTLEPQLEPICDWIEKARTGGGKVLVHCRVGVSRSATVTIAYVMKHLSIPLVDAYLIVRSRRLSVLIQPNMRLLYNLCGWEIKLARLRAGAAAEGDENDIPDMNRLREEIYRTLNWPYLAKEVHALNAKYLH